MAIVLGLSGPQGCGKTSALNAASTMFGKDSRVLVDDFKVSREVQRRLGWTSLDRVAESFNTALRFQQEVMYTKQEREELNRRRTDVDVVLTERTFADIAAYTRLWGSRNNHQDQEWIDNLVVQCVESQKLYAANFILPFSELVPFEEDPHRAKKEDIHNFLFYLDGFFAVEHPLTVPMIDLHKTSIIGRGEEIHLHTMNLILS